MKYIWLMQSYKKVVVYWWSSLSKYWTRNWDIVASVLIGPLETT